MPTDATTDTTPDTTPDAGSQNVPSASPHSVRDVRDPLAPATVAQALRRRVGAAVLSGSLLSAVVVVLVLLPGPPSAAPVATTPVTDATVVVQPGQTLWDVAVATAPADVPTGAWASTIAELNAVGDTLDAWQVLRLPTD